MTPTEARKRLEVVRKEAEGYDDESAHWSEDQFYADVLTAIAAGSRNAKTLAATGLSGPQWALLQEIEETGILYVHRYKRYARTAEALHRRGLIYKSEPDHSRMALDGWSVVSDA